MHAELLAFICLLLSSRVSNVAADYGSCPLVYPPLDLASGSLNQLVDTVLLNLLVPESTIEVTDSINLSQGVVASNIKVYQLDTIHRACPIQLQTNDSLGCTERGLLLKACFEATQIRVNLSLSTPYLGFKHGNYILKLPTVTIQMEMKLFAPDIENESSIKKPAQIVRISTKLSNEMTIIPLSSSWTKNFASGLIKLIYPLIRSKLTQGLDDRLLRMANDRLKAYSINPLFVSPPDRTEPKVNQKRQKRSADCLQAVREKPRVMAFPLWK